MKFIKWAVLALLLISIIAGGFALSLYRRGLPRISGDLKVSGLRDEVKIIRDRGGVPHIYAKNERDLYFAAGYAQAQDRLWQMDLLRRSAKGRISEIFGDRPQPNSFSEGATTVEFDLFSRAVGHGRAAERLYGFIEPESREVLDAYAAGVNAFLGERKGKPSIEFALLGYEPEAWTPTDSLAIWRFVAWGLSTNVDLELMRLLAFNELGEERMWELLPLHKDPGPYVIPREVRDYRQKKASAQPATPFPKDYALNLPSGLLERLSGLSLAATQGATPYHGIPAASNNWAVDGSRTESGKPLLANDPHLPHMLPSIFYPMHLKGGEIEAIGIGFPGFPLVLLGRNHRMAWAATTTRADTQDVFIEKIDPEGHPDQYLYKGEWTPFETVVETVQWKKKGGMGRKDFEILITKHGPVLNGIYPDLAPEDAPPLALAWGGHKLSDEIKAMRMAAKASNVDEAFEAVRHVGAPVQNLTFADDSGGIGYFPNGSIPLRRRHDGSFPVPGWTGEYDWDEWIPPGEIPQMKNPKRGFIVTANNQVVPADDYPYPFSTQYMAGYRAWRIEELLASKDKLNGEDMRRFQLDDVAIQARRVAPKLVRALESKTVDKENSLYKTAIGDLKSWDFDTRTEQTAPALFYRLYENLLRETFEDEISPALVNRFVKGWTTDLMFDNAIERGEYAFFDDVRTKDKTEGLADATASAFRKTVNDLKASFGGDPAKWTWGRIHTMTFRHTFGSQKPLDRIFNKGPFPRSGARHTVDAALFEYRDGDYRNLYGAALRAVYDLSDLERSTWILDGGAGGHPAGRHYADQGMVWIKGGQRPMRMDLKAIEADAEGVLTLKPR